MADLRGVSALLLCDSLDRPLLASWNAGVRLNDNIPVKGWLRVNYVLARPTGLGKDTGVRGWTREGVPIFAVRGDVMRRYMR